MERHVKVVLILVLARASGVRGQSSTLGKSCKLDLGKVSWSRESRQDSPMACRVLPETREASYTAQDYA